MLYGLFDPRRALPHALGRMAADYPQRDAPQFLQMRQPS